jgi:two-component system, chemotaxis family, sensor kinase CheA
MEGVLDLLRNGGLTVTQEVITLLLQCLDGLGQMTAEIEHVGQISYDGSAIVEQLRGMQNNQNAGTSDASPPNDRCQKICRIRFSELCVMKLARAVVILDQIQAMGHVLRVEPPLEDVEGLEQAEWVQYELETRLTDEQLTGKIAGLQDVERVEIVSAAKEPHSVGEASTGEEQSAKPGSKQQKDAELKKVSPMVRVDVERLESLMNLVGELVIDQTRIAQLGTLLRDAYPSDETVDDLEQVSNHISRVIGELQESVMKTRMLPIEQLFNRFPRMVRDLALSLDKDIRLVLEGAETELDRTVIEEIGDPLIHLIRNAIDHGIEPKAERARTGKAGGGTLRLTAAHLENQVVITVEDDGAGLHTERIKRVALEKGLVSLHQCESMSDQDLNMLIFHPGFSTSSVVSDVSGRGVGMDIVRSHIENLNGLIELETKAGEGTRFTIKLPLTLAILRGLLIRLKDITYALPMSSVIEIVRMSRKEISSVKGQAVVKIREQVLPLVWLHDSFRIPRPTHKTRNVFVVVVGSAEKRLGLVVDELVGNQEIVVKSVGSYIGKIDGVSGATILGDGSVALILDVSGLFKMAGQSKAGKADMTGLESEDGGVA